MYAHFEKFFLKAHKNALEEVFFFSTPSQSLSLFFNFSSCYSYVSQRFKEDMETRETRLQGNVKNNLYLSRSIFNTILIIIFFIPVFRRKDTFYQMQVHTPFYYMNYQNYLDNLYCKTSTIKNEEK